jgi:alpha-glucosidase
MENSRATYDGLRALKPDERAFVMTRASYAGGQRYAATWTGDNSSTWDHLKLSVAQTLNLGLSGFSWAGADVGGFTGGPSPELLTRWFQFATFAPIFRDHSQKDVPRAEPWVHGEEHLAIRRKFVEERYRLMPYIYSVAETNSRTGDPIMRPIFYNYPDVLSVDCDTSMQFTLGAKLLVAGSPKPESPVAYKGCLPAGGWYDYWTGKAAKGSLSPNGKIEMVDLEPKIETLPVFVRAGSILAKQPLVQSLSERPNGSLELHVYPGKDCNGEIYDDDGHSMGFTRGEYLRQQISCLISEHGLGGKQSASFCIQHRGSPPL